MSLLNNSKVNALRTVDLFAGCGGMSLGFSKAGFDIVGAYENWKPAIETYRLNFQHPVFDADLSRVSEITKHINKNFGKLDVIIGGPPCQDFSIANNKKTTHRADLTIAFSQIVGKIMPKLFVMENVYNIEKSPYLHLAIKNFKAKGYGLTQRIIEASRVGVPQMRKRYFIVGHLGGVDNAFDSALDQGLSSVRTTVRDYLGKHLSLNFYYAHPRTYKRRAIFSVDEPAATIRRVNRPIPPTYVCHPADKAPVSPGLRALTTWERSQLQTFPANFKFFGAVSQIEQQIGNAVPVLLAQYVGKQILKTLS